MKTVYFFILLVCCCILLPSHSRGQKIVDLCFCDTSDMPNSLLTNTAGDNAVDIGPGTLSDGDGIYNPQANNFDVALPDNIFNDLDGFTLEVDLLVQENFAWIFDSGFDRFRLGVKTNGPPGTRGIRVIYFTDDDNGNITEHDSGFIPNSVIERGERAQVVFSYDQDKGTARVYLNGIIVWETPAADRTPGEAFYMDAEDGTFKVGGSMDGEGSTTPSLYSFKAYKRGCPVIDPPTVTASERCGPGQVSIKAAGAADGNYRWYGPDKQLLENQQNAELLSPSISQNTTFYVSIIDNVCESELVAVEAVIKDVPGAPQADDNTRCGPGNMTLKATGGSPGNYRWYDADQNIIADENDAELLTADLNASRRFFVSVVEDGCESPLTEVQAIIRAVPAAPDVATAENCGPASLTLEALDATNGYYRWYDAERNQIEGENEATFTTPEISKSTTYYVSIVEDGCEGDLAEVPAAIKPVPDAPAAEGDLICGEGTTTLTAEGADDGNFRWYDAEQTLIKGATSAAFTTPLIDESTRFYVSILQDGCESNKTEVLAEVRKEVTPPEANDAFVCGQGSAGLQASGATNGNYRWYDADQNLIPGEQNAVFNTPVLTEDAVFYVSQIAGKCESELTAVEVSIREVPDAPGLTATSSCGAAALQLKATGAEDGAYRWYDHDQNLLPKETSATLATETLQQSSTFYASIVREGCESEKTPVEATINTPPPAPRVSSVERCGRGTFTLQAQDEQGMTYQWYRSDGVTPIRGADGAAYTTARLSNSRAFYVSSFRNGCESEKTEVMARVLPVPTVPGVQEAHFCKPGEKNLQITDAKANMRYRWYASEQAEEALAESNGTFSALIGSDTTFYVSSTNGACESERTIFSVTLEELPAFEAGEDIYLLPGESAVLQPDAGFTDYRWYPARGLDFPDRQEPQASPQRTTTYRVEALTAGGCLISDEITVHVTHQFPVPTAFTPNGDGLNDTWKIPLAYKYPDMQVKIYNRWGELVFESVGYEQAWDGRMMDGKTIEGTYLYHIVLDGESPPRQGKVTVVR